MTHAASPDGDKPFSWAILGTGPVAEKFTRDLATARPPMRAVSVASRQPANATAFAARLGIGHAATDYADAVAHPDVDAVYVATPPALHDAHADLCFRAGKPVLIEKPFAADSATAARMATAARAAGVFCMEAVWTRFLPMIAEVETRISAGDLGHLRQFDASFMGAVTPDPQTSLFDPARGGGALAHRGFYPLALARHFLGPVADLHSQARIGDTGVDEDCTLTLRHTSGALSTLRASIRTGGPSDATVHGTDGTLHLMAPIYRPFAARMTATRARGGGTGGPGGGRLSGLRESGLAQGLNQRLAPALARLRAGPNIRAPFRGNGYHYEAEALRAAVLRGDTEDPRQTLDHSLEIMTLMDAARACWTKE